MRRFLFQGLFFSPRIERLLHLHLCHLLAFATYFSSSPKTTIIMTGGDHDVRAELEREEQLDLVDPLRHFLAIDDDEEPSSSSNHADPSSTDIRDLPSSNDYSLVPKQIESIIDKRATIRYYRDLSNDQSCWKAQKRNTPRIRRREKQQRERIGMSNSNLT